MVSPVGKERPEAHWLDEELFLQPLESFGGTLLGGWNKDIDCPCPTRKKITAIETKLADKTWQMKGK